MMVAIDAVYDASGNVVSTQFVDTNVYAANFVNHPTLPGQTMNVQQFLAYLQLNKAALGVAGWAIPTSLKGYPPGHTRWQVMVDAAAGVFADASVKLLGLTY